MSESPFRAIQKALKDAAASLPGLFRSIQKAHVKGHIRTLDSGKTVWIQDHDDKRQGRVAALHERTAFGKHKDGSHYLRASDKEDSADIQRAILRLGLGAQATYRRGAANHLGQKGTFDHFHFKDAAQAIAVHNELKKQKDLPEELAQPSLFDQAGLGPDGTVKGEQQSLGIEESTATEPEPEPSLPRHGEIAPGEVQEALSRVEKIGKKWGVLDARGKYFPGLLDQKQEAIRTAITNRRAVEARDKGGNPGDYTPVGLEETKAAIERAKHAEPTTDETPAPDHSGEPTDMTPETTGATEAAKPITWESRQELKKRINNGDITPEELKSGFAQFMEQLPTIEANLMAMKKREVIEAFGINPDGRTAKDTQKNIVKAILDTWKNTYLVKDSFAWSPFEETHDAALARVINGQTAEDIQAHAQEVAKARADRAAAIEKHQQAMTDPKTKEDFDTFIKYKGRDALTPDQRAKYDELASDAQREKAEKDAARSIASGRPVATATGGGDLDMKLHPGTHTKTGAPIWTVAMGKRVDRDEYNAIKAQAQNLGGYYSSYRGGGAVQGFIFKSEEAAKQFMAIHTPQGEESPALPSAGAASEGPKDGDRDENGLVFREGRWHRDEESKPTKVGDKFREMADSMHEKADAVLNADRKTNTHKRAAQASHSEGEARKQQALAQTMRNIADRLDSGQAKHLAGIQNRAQVEALSSVLRISRVDSLHARRKAGEHIPDWENATREPANMEDIEHAEYPYPVAYVDNTESYLRQADKTPGAKRAAARIRKYAQMHADGNGRVTYKDPEVIEDWQTVASALPTNSWDAQNIKDHMLARYKRLQAASIKTPEQLRAALREFLPLKAESAGEDPIKTAERALIGARIPGYFPTPRALAAEVVAKADIQPGMRVLEPSAGKGSLIDEIHAKIGKVANIEAIEPVHSLRSILEAKGHNLVGHDIMEHSDEAGYDRIVMNPPFENGQDIDHVRKAYELLKPGGRLVAIMGEGAFSRSDRKASEFREWLYNLGGEDEKNAEGSFLTSDRSTGVNTRTVVIDKPGTSTPGPDGGKPQEEGPKELNAGDAENLATDTLSRAQEALNKANGSKNPYNAIGISQARNKSQEAWSATRATDTEGHHSAAIRHAEAARRHRQENQHDIAKDHDRLADWHREQSKKPFPEGPKEGDRNAEGLVFHDGRWHREEEPQAETPTVAAQVDEPQPEPTPDAEPAPEQTIEPAKTAQEVVEEHLDQKRQKIREIVEAGGGRAKVAEEMKKIRQSGDAMANAALEVNLKKIQDATGLSRAEVMAEFGLKEVTKERKASAPKETLPPADEGEGGDYSSDDPNSPNYRFRDTGYIAGSRKEKAAKRIKDAAKLGEQVSHQTIDWEEIEKNPREAKDLITKSNLFGKVNWDACRDNGMSAPAGFIVDRVYAAIPAEPSEDSPQARQDYSIGLDSLRQRLEACKTADDVASELGEIRKELEGVSLNASEADRYMAAKEKYNEIMAIKHEFREKQYALETTRNGLQNDVYTFEREKQQATRKKKTWSADSEAYLQKKRQALEVADAELKAWNESHPECQDQPVKHPGGWTEFRCELDEQAKPFRQAMRAVEREAMERNVIENPLHRAWRAMGDRFIGVINYQRSKGSEAFARQMAAAKAGKPADWSWAEKSVIRKKDVSASAESTRFQLKVADKWERTGGEPIAAHSSEELKSAFNLRDAQYGNYVCRDLNSAKAHTEWCAAGLSDLADLIGVDRTRVGLNGRLAMAFGARGNGAVGWRTSAPAATYEPTERVINLTKMAGGGTLSHEWFHSLDNILHEALGSGSSSKDSFFTRNPELMPEGPIRESVMRLRAAMLEGEHKNNVEVEYTDRDVELAKHNIDHYYAGSIPGPASIIRNSKGALEAISGVRDYFINRRRSEMDKATRNKMNTWVRLAAAYHDKKPEGGTVVVAAGDPTSKFHIEAQNLDNQGKAKTAYWAKPEEMAARAFEGWALDRLTGQGRRNTYLVDKAENKYYVDPLTGQQQFPYPEGEERDRINSAFDQLFHALREARAIEKAFSA